MRARQRRHDSRLVRVRIDGAPAAVALAAERVRLVLNVDRESRDYENERPGSPGVRRYLDVVIEGEDLLAEATR
jgi:hypothetical protein